MTSDGEAASPSRQSDGELQRDLRRSVGNTWRLGLSFFATWSVAMVVRLLLPRYLGPELFGVYVFADSLAITGLGLLSFGIDSYIQKEIPTRPGHASDFFGGVLVLRTLAGALVIAVLVGILQSTGRPQATVLLTVILGIGYWLQNINKTQAALLQANTTIDGLALTNPVAKVIWGGMVGVGMLLRAPLAVLAGALAASEALRGLVLARLVRQKLALTLRLDARKTWSALVVSFPLYLNALVLALNTRLDVAVLGFLIRDESVIGWYGAAANLAGLTLLLVPVAFPVIMPLLARALARSPDEFWFILRLTLKLLLALVMPGALFLALGADVWIRVAFGSDYAPGALALRVLSAQFPLTYLAMVASVALILLDRTWALTRSSVAGLLAMPVLAVTLVPVCQRTWGSAGAGLGAALAGVGAELIVTIVVFGCLGRRVLDAEVKRTLSRTLVVCLLVAGAFYAMAPLGPLRLAIGAALYIALALLLGAVPVRRITVWARKLQELRREGG